MNLSVKNYLVPNIGMLIVVLFILLFINVKSSKAQETFWANQEKIPEYQIVNNEQPPYLVADLDNTVHAFNSQSLVLRDINSPKGIFYRQWTLKNGWTYPNDILYDETGGDLELVGVSSDRSGVIHLVFQKNFDDLYYTNAYLVNANEPLAWSKPIFIDGQSLHIRPGIPNIGAIAVDDLSGQIVILFSSASYGNGLYYTVSSNNGNSWTPPYPVYLTGSDNLIVSDPKIYVGEAEKIHAVWATINDDGFGGPAYYSSLDLSNNIWSDPADVDTPGIQTPAIIKFNENVFIGYYRQEGNKNWWRYITNEGSLWSDPNLISENHIGRNGAVSFVVDSNNDLHVFFAQRTQDNAYHGVWHSIFSRNKWTTLDSVVKGPVIHDIVGGNGFDPNSVRAIVSNGNVILVTWGTDGGAGQNGAWYSYRILNAPEIPSQPLPRPSVEIENALIENPTASPILTVTDVITPDEALSDEQPVFLSPQTSIFLGIAPVVILLVGFIIVRYFSRFRN